MTQPRSTRAGKIFLVGLFAFLALIIIAVIVVAKVDQARRQRTEDEKQALQNEISALYEDTSLTASFGKPIIKAPYAVYGLSNDMTWDSGGHIDCDALLSADRGLTDSFQDARTVVYVWTDTADETKVNGYYWGSSTVYSGDVWASPVYMTVIDRQDGVRYGKVRVGSVPLSRRAAVKRDGTVTRPGAYNGLLIRDDPDWTTLDMEEWMDAHMEDGAS